VLAFVRRNGYAAGEAEDVTQAFFLHFLERGWYADADPHRGRFRSLLLVALRNFLHDRTRWRRASGGAFASGGRRRDRYGGRRRVPRASVHPAPGWHRARHAMHRLEREWIAAGKGAQFEQLAPLLVEHAEASELRQLAALTGVRSNTIAVQAHRMRQRLRQLVRLELLQTVGNARALEQELAELRDALEAPQTQQAPR
jgi:RNA polymerase sigma-70 factor (ECF subfamily)